MQLKCKQQKGEIWKYLTLKSAVAVARKINHVMAIHVVDEKSIYVAIIIASVWRQCVYSYVAIRNYASLLDSYTPTALLWYFL